MSENPQVPEQQESKMTRAAVNHHTPPGSPSGALEELAFVHTRLSEIVEKEWVTPEIREQLANLEKVVGKVISPLHQAVSSHESYRQEQSTDDSLADILVHLKQTHHEIRKKIALIHSQKRIPDQMIQQMKDFDQTLCKSLPIMDDIVSSVETLRKELMNPVSQELKYASLKTIKELQFSSSSIIKDFQRASQKNTRKFQEHLAANQKLPLLLLSAVVLGFILGSIPGIIMYFQNNPLSSMPASRSAPPAAPLQDSPLAAELQRILQKDNQDLEKQISSFRNIILKELSGTSYRSGYQRISQSYTALLKTALEEQDKMTEKSREELLLMKGYLLLLRNHFQPSLAADSTEIHHFSSRVPSASAKQELKWIQAELRRLSEQQSTAQALYQELAALKASPKVLDISGKRKVSLNLLARKRIESFLVSRAKKEARIYLVDASENSPNARKSRNRLIRYGFKKDNISIIDNVFRQTNKIYAYHKNPYPKAVVQRILGILYPGKPGKEIDITAYEKGIQNKWVKETLFRKKAADIVLRMPKS